MICMSGYTVLYLLATRVFAAPRVQYLAIASLAGAAYFGSTLLPAITLDQQALGAAMIGLFCALVVLLLRGCRSAESFRLPWTHGALILSAVALRRGDDRDASGRRHLVSGWLELPDREPDRGRGEPRPARNGTRLPGRALRQCGSRPGTCHRGCFVAMGRWPRAVRDRRGVGRTGRGLPGGVDWSWPSRSESRRPHLRQLRLAVAPPGVGPRGHCGRAQRRVSAHAPRGRERHPADQPGDRSGRQLDGVRDRFDSDSPLGVAGARDGLDGPGQLLLRSARSPCASSSAARCPDCADRSGRGKPAAVRNLEPASAGVSPPAFALRFGRAGRRGDSHRFLTLASGLACRRRPRPRRAGAGCDSRRDAEA